MNTTDEVQLSEQLFRGLLTVDAEMNVLPDMADNFRVSTDGCTYLFRLREGVRWSDGVPLTAEDFVFAWRQMSDAGLKTAAMLEDVESAEALDDRTLEIKLREPRSYFRSSWRRSTPSPGRGIAASNAGDAWREPEEISSVTGRSSSVSTPTRAWCSRQIRTGTGHAGTPATCTSRSS